MDTPSPLGAPAPHGFTLVELLVALLILSVGALALVGTSRTIAALIGDGAQRTVAARAAQSLLDSLAATPCAALRDGSATTARQVSLAWVIRDSAGLRTVQQRVSFPVRLGGGTFLVTSGLPCAVP
jgi:prepilin-type N-terminal cleavage/methylation domain-containing protein